jgi:hypothetical protein
MFILSPFVVMELTLLVIWGSNHYYNFFLHNNLNISFLPPSSLYFLSKGLLSLMLIVCSLHVLTHLNLRSSFGMETSFWLVIQASDIL